MLSRTSFLFSFPFNRQLKIDNPVVYQPSIQQGDEETHDITKETAEKTRCHVNNFLEERLYTDEIEPPFAEEESAGVDHAPSAPSSSTEPATAGPKVEPAEQEEEPSAQAGGTFDEFEPDWTTDDVQYESQVPEVTMDWTPLNSFATEEQSARVDTELDNEIRAHQAAQEASLKEEARPGTDAALVAATYSSSKASENFAQASQQTPAEKDDDDASAVFNWPSSSI
mgnify:CR=1 FL=1